MTQMTFPVAFPATRRFAAPAPAGRLTWRLRGTGFATALVVNLGAGPASAAHADRGVIEAGPRVPAASTRSWITSWQMSQLPHRGPAGRFPGSRAHLRSCDDAG